MNSKTLTIFASGDDFNYYNLETGKKLSISDNEAVNDNSWHIAFKRSHIKVNGGEAGPSGIVGACIKPPVTASREEFIKLADEDWKKRFREVTTIPEDLQLSSEGVEPGILEWRIKKDNIFTAPPAKAWKLVLADGSSYAKMRVSKVSPDGETMTITYAYQAAKDAPIEDERSAVIEPGQGFSFARGACIAADQSGLDWDIRREGALLLLNSSVSGPGKAGALGSNKYGAMWDSVQNPSDAVAFFTDEYGSLFRTPKWYRYNIDGKHGIHPNGAVYVLRSKEGDFKVQVYDYFRHEGIGVGNLSIRYEKI